MVLKYAYASDAKMCLDFYKRQSKDTTNENQIRSNKFRVTRVKHPSDYNFDKFFFSWTRLIGLSVILGIFAIFILAANYMISFTFREYLNSVDYNPGCPDSKYIGK